MSKDPPSHDIITATGYSTWPYCQRHHILTSGNQGGTRVEASASLTSIHGARSTTQTNKGEKSSSISYSSTSVACNSNLSARYDHWCNSGTDIMR